MNENEFDRSARAWLEDGPTRMADRALLSALEEVHTTRQRLSWWTAWRANSMNTFVKVLAAAVAVAVVAIVGYQVLPRSGGVGGQPTVAPSPTLAPSPSPALLVRGTVLAADGEWKVNATGGGDSVTGTLSVTHPRGNFTVDLKCSRETEDGVILIAGDITDSASPYARKGAREVIVFTRGSPGYFSFDSEGREGGDVVPAASCQALLQQVIDTGTLITDVTGPDRMPIEGTIELGP